jgi:hypothetical protein
MINKPNMRLWRDALLSGIYDQTKGVLRRTDADLGYAPKGYCCLGVACDVSGVGHWAMNNSYIVVSEEDESNAFLPAGVMEWLGLSDTDDNGGMVTMSTVDSVLGDNTPYTATNGYATLTGLNDAGVSFANIAKIITLEFGLDDDD